jgi:hypothetical protein
VVPDKVAVQPALALRYLPVLRSTEQHGLQAQTLATATKHCRHQVNSDFCQDSTGSDFSVSLIAGILVSVKTS